jgi:hypothetical protein
MRIVLAAIAAALVSGCATQVYSPGGPVAPVVPNPGQRPVDPLARTATYGCEDLTTITLTEGQRDARAMLNSGLELGLAWQGGAVFGVQPYEFRALGTEGVWLINGRTVRCRTK